MYLDHWLITGHKVITAIFLKNFILNFIYPFLVTFVVLNIIFESVLQQLQYLINQNSKKKNRHSWKPTILQDAAGCKINNSQIILLGFKIQLKSG